MPLLRRLPLSVLLSVFVSLAFAPPTHAERLPVKLFTSADGLGSSFVNHIATDSRGFLWVCTRDGLSRFDGSRFVTYQLSDKTAAPGFETIYELKNGLYVIGTTSGTYLYDPQKSGPRDPDSPKLNAEFFTKARGQVLQDSTGTIWFGSGAVYNLVFNEGKPVLEKIDLGIPEDPTRILNVAVLDEAADGSVWMSTTWGLVRRLPDSRVVWYKYESKPFLALASMAIDKAGRVWHSNGEELMILKPESIEALPRDERLIERSLSPSLTETIEMDQPVLMPRTGGEIVKLTSPKLIDRFRSRSIFVGSDGTVWVSAENVLLEFSEGLVRTYTDAQGFPSAMARMGEDAAGNLWIGGQTVLARLDRHGVVTYGAEENVNSARYYSVGEAPDGSVFFGKRDFFITYFKNGVLRDVRPRINSTASPAWTTRSAFRSKNGEWWILSNESLYRFSGVTNIEQLKDRLPSRTYTPPDGLQAAPFQIYEDRSGDIWVSTRAPSNSNQGLCRLRKGEDDFECFNSSQGYPAARSVASFTEDRLGNLWLTFYDEGGLARYDGERFTVFERENGIPDSLLPDLHFDSKGRLWLASANEGLFVINNISVQNPIAVPFTTSGARISNNIRTITEDHFGNLYLGTARGVDRLSPETGRVKHFSTIDGLAADFVVDSFRDSRGDLWFATHNGVSRLTPIPDEVRTPPHVFIGGLRIAGNDHELSELGIRDFDKGELAPNESNLQFEFFGLDFCAGETLRYQYKLEGAVGDWSSPTDLRTVSFANLKPGAYKFLVRAVNSDGAASESPATLTFKILPPIWQRWWFMLIAAFVTVGLVVTVYRYRTANLREINAALTEAKDAEERLRRNREERLAELEMVRSRIATDLHDDIGASLTQIAILSEVARTQNGSSNGSSQDPLAKITDVSNELVGVMSDIVWSINPAKDHLSDLTQRMRRFASDLFSPKGIDVRFLATEAHDEVVLGSNLRREVFLVFKESVNNIVKHSGAKSVRIDLGISDGELRYHISDDGRGFDVSDPGGSGNGLASMRKRASEIGGKFTVNSEPGTGTSVSLSIPLERQARA